MSIFGKSISLILICFGVIRAAYSSEQIKDVDLFLEGCHLDTPIPEARWLGLYTHANKSISIIEKVSLEKRKRPAGVDDLFDFCVTAKSDSKNRDQPIVLLSGAIFKEGTIDNAKITKDKFNELNNHTFVGGDKIPSTDEDIKIQLNEKLYTLQQITNLDDHAEGHNHTLKLSHNGQTQTIFSIRGNYEGATGLKILWAGDLDYDGKLDLVLDAPWHYAQPHHLRVFLSSTAKNGDLVIQVGERGFDGI